MTDFTGGEWRSLVDGSVISAIPDNVVDDFESGDLSAYASASPFSLQSTIVAEGNYALQINNPTNAYQMTSESGLTYYPSKGDRFSVLMRDESSRLPVFNFGLSVSDETAYYVLHHPSDNTAEIGYTTSGSKLNTLATASPNLSTGTWYDYEVQWHDGSGSQPDNTIELTVYEIDTSADLSTELGRSSELKSVSVSDSNYSSQTGIGFADGSSDSSPTAYIDRVWHLGSVE